jgi:hypothetical protein
MYARMNREWETARYKITYTVTISINTINQLVFVMEKHCVFFAVRTELDGNMNFISTANSQYILCVKFMYNFKIRIRRPIV